MCINYKVIVTKGDSGVNKPYTGRCILKLTDVVLCGPNDILIYMNRRWYMKKYYSAINTIGTFD